MGITNDEVLTDILVGFEQGYHIAPTTERIEALHETIDTMRKYQKIEEIFDRYDKGELTHNMFGLLVGEVLEDGKID